MPKRTGTNSEYIRSNEQIQVHADTYVKQGLTENLWMLDDVRVPTQYEDLQEIEEFIMTERNRELD